MTFLEGLQAKIRGWTDDQVHDAYEDCCTRSSTESDGYYLLYKGALLLEAINRSLSTETWSSFNTWNKEQE